MERAASPHRARTYAICSNKSPRRSPFTLKTESLLVESASTSSPSRSWFRREVASQHLENGGRDSPEPTRLLSYQAGDISRTAGSGRSARHGADASQSSGWHTAGVSLDEFQNALRSEERRVGK